MVTPQILRIMVGHATNNHYISLDLKDYTTLLWKLVQQVWNRDDFTTDEQKWNFDSEVLVLVIKL